MSSVPPNSSVSDQLNRARSLHQQGNLQEAYDCYQRVLAVDPQNYEALNAIGMLFWQVGQVAEASNYFAKAVAVQPGHFDACYNHAVALQILRRDEEALAAFDKALLIRPDSAEIHYSRGCLLTALRRYEAALESYNKAIALKSDYADAYNNRGLMLLEIFKDHGQALANFDKAIAIKSEFAEAYYNLGLAFGELQQYQAALENYNRAISLKPDYPDAYNNRGIVLKVLERYEEALASLDQAIALRPNYANAYNNRGAILEKLGRFDEALASFDTLISLFPGFADLHYNRGLLLTRMGRYDDALASYETAISLNPNHPDANFNRAVSKLRSGNFEEGWSLYEWRWRTAQQKDYVRDFKHPLWLGEESVANKTVLIHAEQGLGDAIQFVRYAPMLEAKGAKVIVEVSSSLVSLLQSLKGHIKVISRGEPLPMFDLHCPIMSLPRAFKTTLASIPVDIPYLAAVPEKVSTWQGRLGPKQKPRIGLVWSGSISHPNDYNRSIPLNTLLPLLQTDFEFHSLQKEIKPAEQMAMTRSPIQVHDHELIDFSDTAALISVLDLVITIDTSVAHLAGALGKPVWILLPYVADFRWLTVRDDSPWYPTARLFRQQSIGDWDSVIRTLITTLMQKRPGM